MTETRRPAPNSVVTPAALAKGRRTLLLIAAVALAPIVASYVVYYFFPREKQVNYGELLAARPLSPLTGTTFSGKAVAIPGQRGKWLLLVAAPGGCDAICTQMLYATRQARTIQNREQERIERVWLVTDDGLPPAALLAEHPDLLPVRVAPSAVAKSPLAAQRIYLVDPLGNLVLAYPTDPDIKAMANDLKRLLTASRIG